MRIPYKEMKRKLKGILTTKGVEESLAEQAAVILTDNTCDGVASHGINRLYRIVDYIEKGYIQVHEKPEFISASGALEAYDGRLGLGMTNAAYCMDRAIALARENSMGCVALRNTNHWMRGATYGLQAARAGLIGVCFTNTLPNMPAWGAKDNRIGNNPLVVAVPNGERPIVLDMAMSQYSYGKLQTVAMEGDALPTSGGYDIQGNLTTDPKEILKGGRVLPAGFWKGSGLSIILDLMAATLSGGLSAREIGAKPAEYALSQVFIAIDPSKHNSADMLRTKVRETVEYIHHSEPKANGHPVYYPGEQSQKRRIENLQKGIPVDERIWAEVTALADRYGG